MAEWQERLRTAVLREPDHRPDHWRLGGSETGVPELMRATLQQSLQPAAVLVPVFESQGEASLLLTVRSTHLRQHAGQISFPGGRVSLSDPDLIATALREAEEEVGLAREFVEPLGFLGDQVVLTGYRITPVVALVRAGFVLRADQNEVAQHFLLPLAVLMDENSFQRRTRQLRGIAVSGYEIQFEGHQIWGATAGILQRLREALRGNAP